MNEKNDADFRNKRIYKFDPIIRPENLIKEEIWNSIVSWPDYVSLQTSDEHGAELKTMDDLINSLINFLEPYRSLYAFSAISETPDKIVIVWETINDVIDELKACLFNLLHGYYRVAASCLRSGLEIVTIGLCFCISCDDDSNSFIKYNKWRLCELNEIKLKKIFGDSYEKITKSQIVEPLEMDLKSRFFGERFYSIFRHKNSDKDYPGGWLIQLYNELSNFVHSKPTHTQEKLSESSSEPNYVEGSFHWIYKLYLDIISLIFLFIKYMRPDFSLTDDIINNLFDPKDFRQSKFIYYAFCFLYPENKIKINEVYEGQLLKS